MAALVLHQESSEIVSIRRYGSTDVSLEEVQNVIYSHENKTGTFKISYINKNSFYDLEFGYDDEYYKLIAECKR